MRTLWKSLHYGNVRVHDTCAREVAQEVRKSIGLLKLVFPLGKCYFVFFSRSVERKQRSVQSSVWTVLLFPSLLPQRTLVAFLGNSPSVYLQLVAPSSADSRLKFERFSVRVVLVGTPAVMTETFRCVFFSVFRGECLDNTTTKPRWRLPNKIKFIIRQRSFHPMLYILDIDCVLK